MNVRRTLTLVLDAPELLPRRTAYPLTIASRGCVSASTDSWMQPCHPISDDGVLAYVVADGAA